MSTVLVNYRGDHLKEAPQVRARIIRPVLLTRFRVISPQIRVRDRVAYREPCAHVISAARMSKVAAHGRLLSLSIRILRNQIRKGHLLLKR